MDKVLDFIKGKKTYIIAATVCVLGFLEGTDIFAVPEFVWPILGALGLTTLRAGVEKVKEATKP